jgi:uncharacterized protein YggE
MYPTRPIQEIRAELATAAAARDDKRTAALRDELSRAEALAAGTLVYHRDPRLVSYWVRYNSGFDYRFWAEDAEHAIEQAKNAEPGETVVEAYLYVGEEAPEE